MKPRLRTKTGCLTCRQRRKKCDERPPICQGCTSTGKKCEWPTPGDLLDRRFAFHCQSRHKNMIIKSRPEQARKRDDDVLVINEETHYDQFTLLHRPAFLSSELAMAHGVMARDLEIVISNHFVDRYYGLLILPRCHPGFHSGWLAKILDLMASYKFVYYSVLTCAASHIHLIDTSARMQELALIYYSSAITKLSQLLTAPSQLEYHNGLLISIMLLYIHGCMGCGTYLDIPRHLNAATNIITLRFFHRPTGIDRLFDILAVESVLYHIFHVMTGLWSDLAEPDYQFNIDFWTQAETILNRSTFFPRASRSLNSPVLGVPASLFRLALLLRQQCRKSFVIDTTELENMKNEILGWEISVLCEQELQSASESNTGESDIQEEYYRDASTLYTIIVSLLQKEMPRKEPGPPLEVASNSWEVRKAIQILKKYEQDDGWARCFIGNWPTYTLGFFMSATEDKQVIQADMQRRWDLTKLAQITRFSSDLETTWMSRQGRVFATLGTST